MNRKEIFWISITIFFTVVAWMILDIYKIKSNVNLDKEVYSSTIIKYKIDPVILKKLKNKTP